MTNVTQMAETSKNIFCPIDLHQRKMLVGIAVDRDRPSFHEFDTEWDGGVEKLINVLHGLRERHPGAEVWVSYEASGCGFRLADLFMEQGFRASVLAPTNLPVSPRSRTNKRTGEGTRSQKAPWGTRRAASCSISPTSRYSSWSGSAHPPWFPTR